MGDLFTLHRSEGFPTQYAPNKTAATVDVLIAGFICAFLIIASSSFVLLSGLPGKQKLWVSLRITISLFIGAVLMVDNFDQEWEVGEVNVHGLLYRAGSHETINASVGMKFGLRALNVTLKADPDPEGEKINYNERFWWTWDQGRNGFGPYAGRYNQDFRAAQRKGLPLPILWVAEYLTFDGDGIRWGRHYRTAGWYAHIVQWAAFPFWLLSNILFFSVIRYGAYCFVMTGTCMIIANIIWFSVRNSMELVIPLEDKLLVTHFGANFWLNLVVGIICIVLGLVIVLLDLRCPDELSEFFGVDPLANYEEYHLTPEELQNEEQIRTGKTSGDYKKMTDPNLMEMAMMESEGNAGQSQSEQLTVPQDILVLKRQTTSRYGQKSLFRKPALPPRIHLGLPGQEEEPLYENYQGPVAMAGESELYSNLPPPRPPR